ncbi:MAG: SDR family NAD(P)-dependent oxidoreductase, partial [Burkholderiales bacterium]
PQTARARRRLDAEGCLAQWCSAQRISLVILRAPGIYAADRLPLERLRAGTPVLRSEDDVYTNHIHADDLAAIVARALDEDAPAGVYNASDDTEMKMGDWFDVLAERHGISRPPRVSREQARKALAGSRFSFMAESRRLDNRKLKQVLGIRLQFPTIHEGLRHEQPAGIDQSA